MIVKIPKGVNERWFAAHLLSCVSLDSTQEVYDVLTACHRIQSQQLLLQRLMSCNLVGNQKFGVAALCCRKLLTT